MGLILKLILEDYQRLKIEEKQNLEKEKEKEIEKEKEKNENANINIQLIENYIPPFDKTELYEAQKKIVEYEETLVQMNKQIIKKNQFIEKLESQFDDFEQDRKSVV